MYKIGEWGKAQKDFERVFKASIQPFYDGLATLAFKKVCIDPFKFDDFLHQKFGDYEENSETMEYIVSLHYGKEGLKILNRLL